MVAVVVVVGGLFAAGILKLSSSGGGGSSTQYTVTFTETGLPAGASWSVTLNGATQSSTTSTLTFSESNGTYPFTVGTVTGYSASPSSGTVTVNGANVLKSIAFTKATTYSVTFTETGLTGIFTWSVTLNGATRSSSTASIAFTEANGTYSFTVSAVTGYTASPAAGSVSVAGAAVSEAITFTATPPTTYTVAFTETGLASGTSWSVTLAGATQSSSTATITFTEANGTYAFTVATVAGYTASPSSGSVTVNGAVVSMTITFTAVPPTTYTVTFAETGLASGTSWSVTLAGATQSSSTATITFTEANGTYTYDVGAVAGYTSSPSSGSVTVSGVAVIEAITFTAVSPGTYTVTFTETGLTSGTSWSVTLNGATRSSTATSIGFTEANGTYTFSVAAVAGYTVSPSSGSLTVAGSAVTKAITFTAIPPTTYTVTFTETGLPSGTSWSVTLNSATHSSTTASVTFTETNGTYSYSIGTVSGYTASPSSGSVSVNGAAVSQSITFTAVSPGTYTVTFTETGLPSGTSWSVTLNSATHSSTTASVTFTETNGTYSYSIGAVSGYTATPSSGTVTITGAAASVTISFASSGPTVEYPVTFSQTGLPANYTWEVTVYSGILFGAERGAADHTGAPVMSGRAAILIFGEGAEGASFEFAAPSGTYFWIAQSVTNSSYVATPSSGNLTVATGPVAIALHFAVPPSYALTFTETGLPDGAYWSVSVASSSNSTTAPDANTVSAPNGTYLYEVSTEEPGYAPTVPSGNVTVSGRGVLVAVTFAAAYNVIFTETGITGLTVEWQVTFAGITSFGPPSEPIMFTATNGQYPWSASAPGYTASPASGTVTVNGADVSVAIAFTAPPYTVTFTETGLASGAGWDVEFNYYSFGSANAGQPITFNVSNGAYPFTASASGYRASPASGTVTVSGAAVTVPITFTRIATYPVTFTETGLPSGGGWGVVVYANGQIFVGASNFSTTNTLVVNVPKGNYTWVVSFQPSGYVPNPFAGAETILGAGASQAITFTHAPGLHLVLFGELTYGGFGSYGNPNGTTWSVTLGGTTQSTTGMYLGFAEPNGTYSYTIRGPSGYVAVPNAGNFTVNSPQLFAFFSPAAIIYLYFVSGSSGAVGGPTSIGGGSVVVLFPVATRVFYPVV